MALRRYEGVNRGIAARLMPTMMAWPASRIAVDSKAVRA